MIINLHTLTVNPLASLHRYNGLMEQCLASGNLKAHFIRAVKKVFSQNNTEREAFHIFIAVEGLYNNSIYLYGIIMLCRGKPEIRGFRYTNLIRYIQIWIITQICLSYIYFNLNLSYFFHYRLIRAVGQGFQYSRFQN